jgi:hypothetical protein
MKRTMVITDIGKDAMTSLYFKSSNFKLLKRSMLNSMDISEFSGFQTSKWRLFLDTNGVYGATPWNDKNFVF